MRSYLSLAGISAKAHRRSRRVTQLCIMIAVVLVISVFSMVDFEYMHMTEKLVRDHGNWHITLNHVPKEEAESVWNEADVKAACWYDTFNYRLDQPICLDSRPICIIGTEESFFTDFWKDMLTEGRFPQNSSEALLNQNAENILGCRVGDTVVIQTPAGEYSYTVCGFVSDTSYSLARDALIAVLDYTEMGRMAEANGQAREMQYYIQFKQSLSIKKTIANLKASHGWTDENVAENAALLGIMGMSTDNYIVGLYGVAAILVVIVVLAGIMMISGSLNAGVAQRTEYYGMLRCIGAGKRQVKRLVRREALHWLLLAIPAGAVISTLICWVICAVLAYGIGGEWAGMPVGRISWIGIGIGVLVGTITVILAAAAPAKRAAAVSPIAAVSGSGDGQNAGMAKLGKAPVPIALGVHHVFAKKKNLILMTASFALSIILFLTFSVMITWIENALTTNKPYSPDISLYYSDYSAGLGSDLADDLRGIAGVKHVYGRMHRLTEVENCEKANKIDLISYDEIQFAWARADLLHGDIDAAANETGKVIIAFEKGTAFELGDTMDVNGKTLTVAALLSDSPFSASSNPTVICSEETFSEIFGACNYSVIDLQLKKGYGDETVADIRSIVDDKVILSDRREGNTETNSTYLAFSVLVYGFLAMVAMITVFHIINSISMSVIARQRQYGMMRAIGMDSSQLRQMITAESLGYGISGCLVGCAAGLPLHAWFYRATISNYWGIAWQIPWPQLLIIIGVVLCSAFVAARGPVRRIMSRPVTEAVGSL
ncbi:MAG: FtsX-like permease family protein [Oscillospiraceae bacterium]|nr:FtsX-like permease family protein [Oscillospiraceae bacterium]